MRVVSVNVGRPREIRWDGCSVLTGIFKEPTTDRLGVRRLSLDGDVQVDLRVHGGVDKAVYAYPFEHYAHWQAFLGREALPLGQFGENLTVEGLDEVMTQIGDVLRVGTAVLEVSQPRVPCFKLGLRIGTQAFLKPFLQSRRVGFYLRVLEEGDVGAGDTIERMRSGAGGVSVADVVRLRYLEAGDEAELRKAATAPGLTASWKAEFERRLQALTAAAS